MKRYLLTIVEDKEWKTFAKHYKEQGLGNNLDEAIMGLIKNNNERKGRKNGTK